MTSGIDEAWWGPPRRPVPTRTPPPTATDADVDAGLRQAGVDQDDLRHLVEDEAPARTRPSCGRAAARPRGPRGRPGAEQPGQRLMHIEILDEPELEFGGASRHVDPRFGIAAYGPADLGQDDAPTAIRLGLVGPRDQLDGIRRWIERCRRPIAARDSRYPHLFPGFPGCDSGSGLCTTLTIADRNCRELPGRELDRAIGLPGELAVQAMTEVYMSELEALAEGNRVDVIIVARPDSLDDVHLSAAGHQRGRGAAAGAGRRTRAAAANFHDLLKARALRLGIPLQILRRSTWDETAPPPPRRRAGRTRRPARGTCTSPCTTRPAAFRGGCSAPPPTCTPATSASRSTARRARTPWTPPSRTSSTSAARASSSAAGPRTSAARTASRTCSPPTPAACWPARWPCTSASTTPCRRAW